MAAKHGRFMLIISVYFSYCYQRLGKTMTT